MCVLVAQKVALGAIELELQWLWTPVLRRQQQQVLLARAIVSALTVHVLHIMKYLTNGCNQITLSGTLIYIMSRDAGSLYQGFHELHKRSVVE